MTRAPYYTARCGIVYSATTAYTVRDAERHAHAFLDMALTERCDTWSAEWSCRQLADLVAAIREAKAQEVAAPVEPDAPAPSGKVHPLFAEIVEIMRPDRRVA